jgi:hypothetical protein
MSSTVNTLVILAIVMVMVERPEIVTSTPVKPANKRDHFEFTFCNDIMGQSTDNTLTCTGAPGYYCEATDGAACIFNSNPVLCYMCCLGLFDNQLKPLNLNMEHPYSNALTVDYLRKIYNTAKADDFVLIGKHIRNCTDVVKESRCWMCEVFKLCDIDKECLTLEDFEYFKKNEECRNKS